MDETKVARHRSKLKQNGLGGAQNTPNSQLDQPSTSSPTNSGINRNGKRRREKSENADEKLSKIVKKEMPRGQDLVDRIWLEIDNQQREQREKQAIRKAAAEAVKGSSSNGGAEKSPIFLELTNSNLKTLQQDDSIAKNFIQRDVMVDRLLGYKMLLGRMESYTTLGYVKVEEIQDDSEIAKTQRDGIYNINDPEMSNNIRRGPRTPPMPPKDDNATPNRKRGPKTPPGSPGRPITPPPPEPINSNSMERRRMLIEVANMTGTSIERVEMVLGEDLNNAMGMYEDKGEMLDSLKIALQTMSKSQQNATTPKKNISSRISDHMELVSDASLSDDIKPSELIKPEPPPPPPSLPPTLLEAPPIPPPLFAMPPPSMLNNNNNNNSMSFCAVVPPPPPPPPPMLPLPTLPPQPLPPQPLPLPTSQTMMMPLGLPSMSIPPPGFLQDQLVSQPPPPPPPQNQHQQHQQSIFVTMPPPSTTMPPMNIPPPAMMNIPPPAMMNMPPPPPPAMMNVPPPSMLMAPPPQQVTTTITSLGMTQPPPPPPSQQQPAVPPQSRPVVVGLKSIVDLDQTGSEATGAAAIPTVSKVIVSPQQSTTWRSLPPPPPPSAATGAAATAVPTTSVSVQQQQQAVGNTGERETAPAPVMVSHNVQSTLFSALGLGGGVGGVGGGAVASSGPTISSSSLNLSSCNPVSAPIPVTPMETSVTSEPLLLDRYGCPLPVPGNIMNNRNNNYDQHRAHHPHQHHDNSNSNSNHPPPPLPHPSHHHHPHPHHQYPNHNSHNSQNPRRSGNQRILASSSSSSSPHPATRNFHYHENVANYQNSRTMKFKKKRF